MRPDFHEEHERAKRIENALSLKATGDSPLIPLASEYSEILIEAKTYAAQQLEHDRQGIALGLIRERLAGEMVQKRKLARCTVQSMADEGENSALLPTMGYKRANDYDSGLVRKKEEPAIILPLSGVAPSSGGS